MNCGCRWVKELPKVWKDPSPETSRFLKERTLIVENTPQKCIRNYGNAILVPTYNGQMTAYHAQLTENFKLLVSQLEQVDNVREMKKCVAVGHRIGPHPCFEQDWWTQAQCSEIIKKKMRVKIIRAKSMILSEKNVNGY